MNAAEVRSVPEMNGFRGEFQKIDRSGWHPVQVNGIAQLYATPELAEIAAYRAMIEHIFGRGIVRSGEKASAAKIAANKIFPGRGRVVEVERR